MSTQKLVCKCLWGITHCTPTVERTQKLISWEMSKQIEWPIHGMGCYQPSTRIKTQSITWINLKSIVLGKGSGSQKSYICAIIPFI